MKMDLDLEEIILYLNATEPTGKYCKNIENLKNKLQRLEAIDNANPSEALQALLKAKQERLIFYGRLLDNDKIFFETLEPTLLKAQEQDFNYKNIVIPFFDELVNVLGTNDIDEMLDKIKEQKKENELLREIIKSLFDRGCPLHQYIDKDFGLEIEVDDECSTMILGEYKGVDLDKYLKEVLCNG